MEDQVIKPDLTEKANQSVVPIVQNQEIPKTKNDWDKLSKEDPSRWMSLTQDRMDQTIREARELKEKLTLKEQQEKNLLIEIDKLKKPAIVVDDSLDIDKVQEYGNGKYPETEEAWDNLFIARPAFATDLRNEYFRNQDNIKNEFISNRKTSVLKVQEEHPDMYVHELDDNGKARLDAKGKPVLKIDPSLKTPIFNPESDKGRIWQEIYDEDQRGWSSLKNAPVLMMAEMERRLRAKGANIVKNNGQSTLEEDQTALAPQGVMPPIQNSLKFASEEEKGLAERAVSRGTYASLEQYVEWRDKGKTSFRHNNSRPDFSKK